MHANHLIERNTRAHSQDGYTSWHMVAAAHEATIRDVVAQLNAATGIGVMPAHGCELASMFLGDAAVWVEYEFERGQREITQADPDDCQEGIAPSVSILQVYINGRWCDAQDVVPDAVLTRWEESLLGGADA